MSTLTRAPLTAARQSRTWLGHRVLGALTYPHGVEGYRAAYRPGATADAIPATVVSVTPRGARAASILLRPRRPLSFRAGQHLLVTVEVDGVIQTRCYSFSDANRTDGLVEITVAHIPEGRVSGHLVTQCAPGEVVGLSSAMGEEFALPDTRPSQVLLIAGGSGITPLRSIWRTLVAEGAHDRVTVLAYARTAEDALFVDEVIALGGHMIMTRDEASSLTSLQLNGRFDAAHLDALDLDWTATEIFACGPVGLVDAVRDAVADRAPEARVHTESFAPAFAPAHPDAVGGLLTFADSGVTAHTDGTTLLEQAEAAGLSPKSGCRMGICHSCDVVKHAGVVTDIRTGESDDGTTRMIQPCISRACGDVQIAL